MTTRSAAHAGGREVVGLYGDPDSNWSIGLEAGVARDLDPAEVEAGLRRLTEHHPNIGVVDPPVVVSMDRWVEVRSATLAKRFSPEQPLVRVVMAPSSAGPDRLLVVAHHGLCDGLGLLAFVGVAIRTPVLPTTPGLGARSANDSFVASIPRRVVEAVRRPPPRFPTLQRSPASSANEAGAGADGEEVAVARSVDRVRFGTVGLCQALAGVFADRGGRPGAHPLLFVGASRRAPRTVAPDRQTAYLRFRVDPGWTTDEVAAAFRGVEPEPDFPETSMLGLAPRLVRPLRNRLGSTAVVSNLGILDGDVEWVSMFPALSGPAAVGIGLATTATRTTLSVRTRAHEFGRPDADDLLESLVARAHGAPGDGPP